MTIRRNVGRGISAALLLTVVLTGPAAFAATYYWDNNGTNAGFGTAGGTWAAPTVSQWSSDGTGVATPGASITTATGDALNFGNGGTGLAAGTVTISGSVSAGNMTFASGSGAIVLSGGTAIGLASPSTITLSNSADTISTPITSGSLTLAGTGTLTLSSSNSTYSGGTTLGSGTLSVSANSTPTSGTVTSGPLGTGTLTLNGGTLQNSAADAGLANAIQVGSGGGTLKLGNGNNMTLTGPLSGAGNLTVAPAGGPLASLMLNFSQNTASGTITISNSSGNNQTVTRFGAATAGSSNAAWSIGGAQDRGTTFDFGTGTISFGSLSGSGLIQGNAVGGTHTMSVGALGSNTTFSGTIKDTAGTTALTVVGGSLTLTGTGSSFAGTVAVENGSLIAGNTVSAGANSPFGNSSAPVLLGDSTTTTNLSAMNPKLLIGGSYTMGRPVTVGTNGSLGNAGTTFTLGGSTASNSTFSGAITLNQSCVVTQAAGGTLTLSGAINGGGALTKTGAGTVTLAATNGYTGATTVSNGVLQANGILAASPVTLATGTTITGSGSVLGGLSLNGSAMVKLQNGAANTLTVSNGLTLTDGNVLNFDLGPTNASDKIAVLAGSSYSGSGTVSINLTNLSGFGVGTYPLITGATGIATNTFVLLSTPSSSLSFTLAASAGVLSVIVSPSGATPAMAYWTGATNSSWNTLANWATNQAGTSVAAGFPSNVTTVVFASDNASNFNTTVDGDISVNNLSFTTPSNTVIAGASTLTLVADFAGITVNPGAGTNTLSAPMTLGASQSWNNNAANPLVINGTVSGSGKTLTLAGSGTVRLGASNRIDDGATLVVSGGTFDLAANNETVAGVQVAGNVSGAGILTSSTAFDLRSGTVSAVLAGSAGAVKTTGGTAVLSATNMFTGGVAINGGVVRLVSPEAAGVGGPLGASGVIAFGGGVLQYSALNTNDYSGRFSAATGQLYSVDMNGQAVSFASGLVSTNGMLTVSGGGQLTLAGVSLYAGGTTVNGGTLRQGVSNAFGSTNGTLTVNSNATVDINGYALGVGALGGNGGTLLNNGGAATLTVGNGNGTGSSSTLLADGSGVLAVSKVGSGTWTITTSNTYSGGTTLGAGTISVQVGSTGAGASLTQGPLGTGTVTLAGGTLQLVGAAGRSFGNNLFAATGTASIVDSTTSTGQNTLLNGNVSGNGTITAQNSSGPALSLQIGSGSTPDWSGFTGTFIYSTLGANTFNLFAPTASMFDLSHAAVVLTGSQNSSTFRVAPGYTTRFGSLSGGANVAGTGIMMSGGSGTLEVGNLNTDTTYAGPIGGESPGVSLIKVGTGALTLSGANTYTGSTTVSNGTLCVNGSLGNTMVTVDPNATLSGTGTVNNVVTNMASGKLSPGWNGFGTLTLSRTPVLQAGSVFTAIVNTNGTSGVLSVMGSLSVTNMILDLEAASNLNKSVSSFVIATATNGVSGPFLSKNVPVGWGVDYGSTNISISLRPVGSMLIVE